LTPRPLSVLTTVDTLGQAWKLGWRVRARCLWFGPGNRTDRHLPWCDTMVELDTATLVWTRGAEMPLEILQERLRCPKCGNRKIVVYFDVPNQPQSARVAG
jgi:hypothetical protein